MTKYRGFLIFYDWLPALEALSPKDFKALVLAMCYYQKDGTPPPDFPARLKQITTFVFPQLDRRKHMSELGKKGAKIRYSESSAPVSKPSIANNGGSSDADSYASTALMAKDKDRDQDENKDESQSKSETYNGDARAEKNSAEPYQNDGYVCKGAESYSMNGYGTYKNVFLSNDEYLKIKSEIKNADEYIDTFSRKIHDKGYRYPNHAKAIFEWWERDKQIENNRNFNSKDISLSENAPEKHHEGSFDTDSFFEAAVRRSLGLDK